MTTIADVTRVVPGIAAGAGAPASRAASAPAGAPAFKDVLADSLARVNELQHAADRAIGRLASNGPASLHDTMLAVEQADQSFRLMMLVRNKIVEAYQEVLRMGA